MTATAPYYTDEHVTLYHGDCMDVLAGLPDGSVDSVVTDPPYGIAFMGKAWDQPGEFGSARRSGTPGVHRRGPGRAAESIGDTGAMDAGRYDLSPSAMRNFQAWCLAWASECLRVLKPGGHLLAFGGSRTWHRLAAGIEDAGFEIRDSIAWLYGSGFPKSMDVSKAIDRSAGAVREVVGTKLGLPGYSLTDGNGDHRTYSRGLGNTGAGSAECAVTAPATPDAEAWQGWGTALKPGFEPVVVGRKPLVGTVAANVLAHGTGALNVDGCRVPSTDGQLAEKYASVQGAGARSSTVYGTDTRDRAGAAPHAGGRWPTNVVLDEDTAAELDAQAGPSTSRSGAPRAAAAGDGWGLTATGAEYDDQGGPSRFFPVFRYEAKAPSSQRPRVGDVVHPTVKPLDLMRWLVRLVTPPGGVVLDPFAGSGTTAEACVVEGFQCVTIEREAAYLDLITARLTRPIAPVLDLGEAS